MINDNNVEQVVDEATYPSRFDMDHFKTLNSFKDRIDYCVNMLGKPLGSGSARTVFAIDNETVLKLAKNSKGIAQNEVEINTSALNYDVVAKVIDYEPRYLWLETQRAEKITPNQFKQILGFSVNDFGMFIRNYEVQNKGKRPIFSLDKNIDNFMWNNEWCDSVRGLIDDSNMSAGDLGRISSYGKIGNEVVIIDYGIDDDLLNTFYRKNIREDLKKEGYDGIITREGDELGEIIAFDNSEQSIENIESNPLNEVTCPNDYKSWKRKNITLRGVKEVGEENNGGAMLGKGLYSAFLSNKDLAKQYGEVKFVLNGVPKKPKIFNTLNEWEIWFYNTLVFQYSKQKGKEHPDKRDFDASTTIEDEMEKLGFDGIVIKGREMVNYKPKNVLFFRNENELYNYYEIVVKHDKTVNLNESINTDALDKKNVLNPQFFKEDKLKELEREKLLGLAKKYINALDIKGLKVKDIVFTGSNANYNYTNESDVDIHILVDYSKLGDNEDLIKDLFMQKKDNWSNKYEVTIHKHPTELFVQDIKQPREWSAEYSLIKDKWIKEPKIHEDEINDEKIENEAKKYMEEIDSIIKSYNKKNSDKILDELEEIRVKIKDMRGDSLNDEKTEFAEGNLVFKLLRNNNYFDKMQEFKKKIYQDQFGLKEHKTLIIKESQYNLIKDKLLTYNK
jgi:predicted nucleotidyltransferase